ncbi:MAG: hypothetical protein IJZ27_06995, partial [Treponema sp.]|nr:hypothetical protein [Treponema sp.]
KGYHKEIDELGERESEARKAFDDYVPVQPRRKKHSFGFIKWEEIDKEYAEKENIRRIKKLEEKLDSVLHRIDTTKFQIECNDVIMNRIEDTKNFVVGLSDEDRLAIREKYHLIEGLFYQNEEIYAKIARIEELKKNVPSFTEYFRENVSEPERTKFNKFTAFLDKTFSYANEQQFKKSAERIKKITDLTKYVDFGEYNRHVDCVALAMDHEKQLEDQRRKEERVKANANKQNGKKNPVVKKKTVSSSESENGKSL